MLQEKGKKAKSYINLQKNLMSKFDEVTVLEPKSQEVDELGFLISEEMYNNQQNNVNDLIQRAKNLVSWIITVDTEEPSKNKQSKKVTSDIEKEHFSNRCKHSTTEN
jgi:hypothetical protein